MRSRVALWWEGKRTEPQRSDEELAHATRQVTKAIVQTVNNRTNRRPDLSVSDVLESARRQRSFDRETIETYRENIGPELRRVRSEYVARGDWTPELDRLVQEPRHVGDLRELVIALEERVPNR